MLCPIKHEFTFPGIKGTLDKRGRKVFLAPNYIRSVSSLIYVINKKCKFNALFEVMLDRSLSFRNKQCICNRRNNIDQTLTNTYPFSFLRMMSASCDNTKMCHSPLHHYLILLYFTWKCLNWRVSTLFYYLFGVLRALASGGQNYIYGRFLSLFIQPR